MSEETPKSVSQTAKVSHRQLKLLHLENPLTLRLGNDFFRAMPSDPGVYFFHGTDDQLLYIGQSNDLRARVGSYRHVTPEQHPKRTLRLVSKVTHINWEVCGTAAEAIERERVLLLEHRPPFNRAGVWRGDPWWLVVESVNGKLHLKLHRQEDGIGPLPPGFRFVMSSLVRALFRLAHPSCPLAGYPHHLTHDLMPLQFQLLMPSPETTKDLLQAFLCGQDDELMNHLTTLPGPETTSELDHWLNDLERLGRYQQKTPPASRRESPAGSEGSERFVLL